MFVCSNAWCSRDPWLTDEMRSSLTSVCLALLSAGPRIVKSSCNIPPIVIFTDGACEPEGTSIGGMFFEHGSRPQAFGAMLSDEVVQKWASKVGQKQVIGQAEIFPVLVARLTWSRRLQGRRVLYFIDNDSARLALIKSYSPVLSSLRIISDCTVWDCRHDCTSWYARVPTEANCADGPSRLQSEEVVAAFGAEIVKPVFPAGGNWSTDVL